MSIYSMYKEMEGKTVIFYNGWAHPTIVEAVGNSTPVSISIANGYATYNNIPLRLTKKGWLDLYLTFRENKKSTTRKGVSI